jgi:hypothetical protein
MFWLNSGYWRVSVGVCRCTLVAGCFFLEEVKATNQSWSSVLAELPGPIGSTWPTPIQFEPWFKKPKT